MVLRSRIYRMVSSRVLLLVLWLSIFMVVVLANNDDVEGDQMIAVPLILNGIEQPVRVFADVEHFEQSQNKGSLDYYNNMSSLLGVDKVSRCPFEYIQAPAPYDPVVVVNRAIEVLFKQGYFQASLTCFQYAYKSLNSGLFAFENAEQKKSLVQSIKDNIDNAKFLLKAPTEMFTKRMFHIPSNLKFPHSSKPVKKRKDRSIMIFDGALSQSQCENIIGLFEVSELYQGNVFNGQSIVVDTKNKNVWEFDISGTAPNDPKWAAVDRLMVSLAIKHLIKYEQHNLGLSSKFSPLYDGGFQMKRYRHNESLPEHHAYHIDAGQFPHCGPQRLIAFIVYLNDVAAGGETVFFNHGVVVKPKCGRVLMFPTALEFPHAGRSPISNTKYDIIGFIME